MLKPPKPRGFSPTMDLDRPKREVVLPTSREIVTIQWPLPRTLRAEFYYHCDLNDEKPREVFLRMMRGYIMRSADV